MSALKQFIPPKEKMKLVQGHVPEAVWEDANKHREQNGWTWPEFLEALLVRELKEAKLK